MRKEGRKEGRGGRKEDTQEQEHVKERWMDGWMDRWMEGKHLVHLFLSKEGETNGRGETPRERMKRKVK